MNHQLENLYTTREHSIDFAGQRYLRFVPLKYFSTLGGIDQTAVSELSVHDATKGLNDTWIFVGGKNYRATFLRQPNLAGTGLTQNFADFVHAAHPAYSPYLITGAEFFFDVQGEADRIETLLDINPDVQHWAINFGTYEVEGMPVAQFRAALETIVKAVKARGKDPLLATVPYIGGSHPTDLTAYNAAIASLVSTHGLHAAPDLYTYFRDHPTELCDANADHCEGVDDTNFDERGAESVNRLWAQAVSDLYAP